MEKHTPGPWLVFKHSDQKWWEVHFGTDEECVAEIVHEEADAHLIAAAPEMYKALLWAIETRQVDGMVADLVEEAIKKAEGRHQSD